MEPAPALCTGTSKWGRDWRVTAVLNFLRKDLGVTWFHSSQGQKLKPKEVLPESPSKLASRDLT